MAYVPGFRHDVFISYAHGDDRDWINRLVDRLLPAVKHRLGVEPSIWIDDDELRRSRDFSKEIPESVKASAVFLLLPSPTYIRSRYCIDEECRVFDETVAGRRARFGPAFANDLFVLRCPILPIDNNEHWSLFPGATDIPFCDDADMFAAGSPPFETTLRRLVGELVGLLKRMRNQSTAVFLYPPTPPAELQAPHTALAAELAAHSYRILPDRTVNLAEQLREASLAVFLLGADYEERARELADLSAARQDAPWVVWCSPAADQTVSADQIGFAAYLEQLDAPGKTFLTSSTLPAKLKEEVLGLLRPQTLALPDAQGKPRIYLVYNARDRAEIRNAGLISFHYRKDFHFDHPDDPAQHALRLSHSDGVLLVWGNADEDWCSREFAEMVQISKGRGARGLCLFDPPDKKTAAVEQIRKGFGDLYIGDQFGRFDPARLSTFFTPVLRRTGARA
jgi:hypothetical protein